MPDAASPPQLGVRDEALEIHLVDRPDLPSVGAGETPLIAVAPAIANAVAHATGVRFDDPAIGVRWPLAVTAASEQDRSWPLLESRQ